jgi:hypothetical protein
VNSSLHDRQIGLVALCILAAKMIQPGSSYESDDPEADRRNRDTLDQMVAARGGGGDRGNMSSFAGNYSKIRGKMNKKYGAFVKKAGIRF